MMVVRLIQGQDNQLFQHATARRIAYINKSPFKLDISWVERYKIQ